MKMQTQILWRCEVTSPSTFHVFSWTICAFTLDDALKCVHVEMGKLGVTYEIESINKVGILDGIANDVMESIRLYEIQQ